MRRRKRRGISTTKILIIFVACTLTFSVGYSLLAQQLTVEGKSNLVYTKVGDNEFESSDLNMKYDENHWYSGGRMYYQYNIELTNISDSPVSDWKIEITLPPSTKYENGWSARYVVDNGILTITKENAIIIEPGKSVKFGVQVSMTDTEFKIEDAELFNTTEKDNDPNPGVIPDPKEDEDCPTVIVNAGNTWTSNGLYYTQYEILVKNETTQSINDWSTKVKLPNGAIINSSWGANVELVDNYATLTPFSYNSTITPNNQVVIGMIVAAPTTAALKRVR